MTSKDDDDTKLEPSNYGALMDRFSNTNTTKISTNNNDEDDNEIEPILKGSTSSPGLINNSNAFNVLYNESSPTCIITKTSTTEGGVEGTITEGRQSILSSHPLQGGGSNSSHKKKNHNNTIGDNKGSGGVRVISPAIKYHKQTASDAEVFAQFRVLDYAPTAYNTIVPLHEEIKPQDIELSSTTPSFYDDFITMRSGSVPHSMLVGTTIGIVCGILAYLYYTTLEWLLEFLWKTIPNDYLSTYIPIQYHWVWIIVLGYCMALGVGISVKYLGEPGDLSYTVQCVHDKAYIGMDHVLPMLCSSQFSILGGGSLGPEAPLVAICASFSGYISRKVFKETKMNVIRKHTLMGMACALAAFFGVPLGGSLFALEINNRFGIEYYEHTIEAIFSGTVCLCVFRGLARLSMGPIWTISETTLPTCLPSQVLLGAAIGLLGASVAAIFSQFHQNIVMTIFKKFDLLHNKTAISRALFGSTFILLIGIFIPQTMFWGEMEFETLATMSPASELSHVYPTSGLIGFEMNSFSTAMIVGIFKLIAISFTVAAGYRGGFIFPFFAAGAAFGRALVFIFPTIPIQLATLCFAAGINVAITRTSMATTLILAALSGEINANPPILAASMVSLFVTSYMPFIRSQVKRKDIYRHSDKSISGPSARNERSKGDYDEVA